MLWKDFKKELEEKWNITDNTNINCIDWENDDKIVVRSGKNDDGSEWCEIGD